jgi:hypothetical protein
MATPDNDIGSGKLDKPPSEQPMASVDNLPINVDPEKNDLRQQRSENVSTLWDKLPSWVSANLRSGKSWKLLFRCWIACFVSFIILLPNKSLQTLGNT